jgi:hypothetical protein
LRWHSPSYITLVSVRIFHPELGSRICEDGAATHSLEFVPKEDEKSKTIIIGTSGYFQHLRCSSFETYFPVLYNTWRRSLFPEPPELILPGYENDHMIKIIQKYPLYLFLLPYLFVLHGFTENFGFIEVKEAALLLLSYLFLRLASPDFLISFFRNWNRASLITTFWISFFFFLEHCTSS